jgi:hypothetical protein
MRQYLFNFFLEHLSERRLMVSMAIGYEIICIKIWYRLDSADLAEVMKDSVGYFL